MCRAAGTPRNRSTVGRVPLPMIPATVRQSIRQAVATVRPCAAPPEANAAGFATIEHAAGFRQAVRPVSDSGDRVPRPACQRARIRRRIPATSNAATVGRKCAAPPVSLSGKDSGNRSTVATVRACQRFGSRHHRTRASRGDRVPPDSGQCRRILPAVCATVGRPACYRGNRSRLARLFSPETRRNRPPLRPPAPDGFAPVTPCRALARPFNAA
jgi:hypothetical protein